MKGIFFALDDLSILINTFTLFADEGMWTSTIRRCSRAVQFRTVQGMAGSHEI